MGDVSNSTFGRPDPKPELSVEGPWCRLWVELAEIPKPLLCIPRDLLVGLALRAPTLNPGPAGAALRPSQPKILQPEWQVTV